ncbi:hypothetical protein TRAPUB_8056 [Trametes pubescens]|uniref:Uncharacterized protein n=1 Tax=Trametes pubescens TaxID=154538 RepID=A0A1M2W6B5_TRAPU|nr:hypothetical protein TRAPUB_8056 [Trametes pubescens]
MSMRAPSPPPAVAGIKRPLRERAAHDLENGKVPKLRSDDNPKPLELNYRPVHKVHVRRQPSTAAHTAITARSVRDEDRLPQLQLAQTFRDSGARPAQPMQGMNPAPLIQHYAPQHNIQVAPLHAMNLVPAAHVTQPSYLQLPPGMVPMQVNAAHPGMIAADAYGYGPAGYQTYPGPYANMGQRQDLMINTHSVEHSLPQAPVPQNAEEALHLLRQMDPQQRDALMQIYQTYGEGPASQMQTPTVSQIGTPQPAGEAMHVDDERTRAPSPPPRDKGKGRETAGSADVVMEPEQPTQDSANLEGMTSQFGLLLLNTMQESHIHMAQLMTDFMAKQAQVQERFCKTVEHDLSDVRTKVLGLQNPVPLHGHRRTPKGVAFATSAAGSSTTHTAAGASSPGHPTSPAKRMRADRKRSTEPTDAMDAILTLLKAAVRKHLRTMLNFATWEELVLRYPPLTEEEIAGYRMDDDSVVCTAVEFRVDFVHDWKRLPFNREARAVFIQNMAACIQGGTYNFTAHAIPLISEEHIGSVLDSHMEYCRRKYREIYRPPRVDNESDAEDSETQQATRREKREKVNKSKAVTARKGTLHESRLCVIVSMDMGLERHYLLFQHLLPQNMSGDETDGPPGLPRKTPMLYRIVEALWQSAALKAFLRALDVMYREDWGKRAPGGNPPRTRVLREDGRVEEGHPPEGLWRNCYDQEWLQSLRPYRRRALRIIDADYDFDLTPEFSGSEDEIEEEL